MYIKKFLITTLLLINSIIGMEQPEKKTFATDNISWLGQDKGEAFILEGNVPNTDLALKASFYRAENDFTKTDLTKGISTDPNAALKVISDDSTLTSQFMKFEIKNSKNGLESSFYLNHPSVTMPFFQLIVGDAGENIHESSLESFVSKINKNTLDDSTTSDTQVKLTFALLLSLVKKYLAKDKENKFLTQETREAFNSKTKNLPTDAYTIFNDNQQNSIVDFVLGNKKYDSLVSELSPKIACFPYTKKFIGAGVLAFIAAVLLWYNKAKLPAMNLNIPKNFTFPWLKKG